MLRWDNLDCSFPFCFDKKQFVGLMREGKGREEKRRKEKKEGKKEKGEKGRRGKRREEEGSVALDCHFGRILKLFSIHLSSIRVLEARKLVGHRDRKPVKIRVERHSRSNAVSPFFPEVIRFELKQPPGFLRIQLLALPVIKQSKSVFRVAR